MKWPCKASKVGRRRVVKRFLLIPRNIDCQIRWLEWAHIEQEYQASAGGLCEGTLYGWNDIHWFKEKK